MAPGPAAGQRVFLVSRRISVVHAFGGFPVASVQETTIRGLAIESGEESEGLLPQIPQMKTPDSFRI
jgi:hypothetical protein